MGSGRAGGGEGEVLRRGSLTLSSACGVGGGPGSSSGISGSVSWVRIRWNGGSRVRVCGVFPLCLVFLLPRMRRGSCGNSICDDVEGFVAEGLICVFCTCRFYLPPMLAQMMQQNLDVKNAYATFFAVIK